MINVCLYKLELSGRIIVCYIFFLLSQIYFCFPEEWIIRQIICFNALTFLNLVFADLIEITQLGIAFTFCKNLMKK